MDPKNVLMCTKNQTKLEWRHFDFKHWVENQVELVGFVEKCFEILLPPGQVHVLFFCQCFNFLLSIDQHYNGIVLTDFIETLIGYSSKLSLLGQAWF